MASVLPKTYPKIYILSKIPQLLQHVKNIVPDGVTVSSLSLPQNGEKEISDSEQRNCFKDVEVCLCDPQLVTKAYEQFPNVKWIQSTWAGIELILAAIEEKKTLPSFILTRFASDEFSALMAEYVMCQILNWERKMNIYWKHQELKKWNQSGAYSFKPLSELRVSILGIGSMGCGVAKYLRSWGTVVVGFSKNERPPGAKEYSFFYRISTDIKEVLKECDYLINVLPATPETHGLLNGMVLSNCEQKPVFVNVGRGSIIKEQYIIEAIRSKWISAAILDVFEEEPLPKTSKLWEMPEVIITPHIAAVSSSKQVASAFLENYNKYIAHEKLEHVVNFSAGY